jgi:Protein of unknown function (DUF1186)
VDIDSPEVWSPAHAVRVLTQLRAEAAIEPIIKNWESFDHWMTAEIENFFAELGDVAIPSIEEYLNNTNYEVVEPVNAASALKEIALKNPEQRELCVNIITQHLENFAENDSTFNANLIGELVDLEAIESAPLIEKAFAANKVDSFIVGSWELVQIELGLLQLVGACTHHFINSKFKMQNYLIL